MPKLKTNSAAKKRYRKTATGKLKFKKPGLRHLLHQEPSSLKRPKRNPGYVNEHFADNIKKMLPY
ncbi:MAG TPA: 50S ribosomal protein L35 [bacterium]|nr:50S ribosomal protein L35 [bacterium]